MITAKIDMDKIDRSKLFKGTKGTYLDVVLIDTPGGQYGDYMVVQSVTKEERMAGVRGAILGNGKVLGGKGGGGDYGPETRKAKPQAPVKKQAPADDGEPPF